MSGQYDLAVAPSSLEEKVSGTICFHLLHTARARSKSKSGSFDKRCKRCSSRRASISVLALPGELAAAYFDAVMLDISHV